MEIFCCPVQFFGWGPGRLRPSCAPLLLIVTPPTLTTTCTRDRIEVCPGLSTSQQESCGLPPAVP